MHTGPIFLVRGRRVFVKPIQKYLQPDLTWPNLHWIIRVMSVIHLTFLWTHHADIGEDCFCCIRFTLKNPSHKYCPVSLVCKSLHLLYSYGQGAPGYLSGITLGSEHWLTASCPGLCIEASVTINTFSDPSKTSMLLSWFYLVYLIWCYYLYVNLSCELWNRKLKINKMYLIFFKIFSYRDW